MDEMELGISGKELVVAYFKRHNTHQLYNLCGLLLIFLFFLSHIFVF